MTEQEIDRLWVAFCCTCESDPKGAFTTAVRAASNQAHSLTLTARQMRDALEFCNPDGPDDNDQMDDDVVIEWRDAFKDDEGNEHPAGYYAYMAEYPEEGFYGPLM